MRPALIAAARALLDEGGPDAVGLREAARRVGVSPTATYRHFKDKDALLAALAVEGFHEFGAALAASESAPEPLSAMGAAYVDFALAKPGMFRLMFSPMLSARRDDEELQAAARRGLRHARPRRRRALRRAAERADSGGGDRRVVAGSRPVASHPRRRAAKVRGRDVQTGDLRSARGERPAWAPPPA